VRSALSDAWMLSGLMLVKRLGSVGLLSFVSAESSMFLFANADKACL